MVNNNKSNVIKFQKVKSKKEFYLKNNEIKSQICYLGVRLPHRIHFPKECKYTVPKQMYLKEQFKSKNK